MLKKSPESAASDHPSGAAMLDPETGLASAQELLTTLRREIARSKRYGDRSSLAAFDIRVVGHQPSKKQPRPPSPARFVSSILAQAARESDLPVRLDTTHFLVLLTECDDEGAAIFAERARTKLSSFIYARNDDGSGIYVRAWAGWAAWTREYADPQAYIGAALAHLAEQRPLYTHAEREFEGRRRQA